ncbi:protein NLP5-like [Macadamia integrifolia]|uniref:protein NLP5-like n=1 Tax=Macadamia integrifolia TaxID=60698 RepID=UPI001C4F99FD|nr:protein NLP5-like [Macadamia integrifolia]XP_042489776.1 protein NLP5-like [Macadamia integrifolia]
MEDGAAFRSDSMLENFPGTVPDFDLMDELLLGGGCWLETSDGSNFLQQPGPSTSTALFDSSYFLRASEYNHGCLNPVSSEKDEEETKASTFPENLSQAGPPTESPLGTRSLNQSMVEITEGSGQLLRFPAEGSSEVVRKWWIGPRENLGPPSVRERLIQALGYIREFTKDRDILIQVWVPTRRGERNVLRTDEQPFSLQSNCSRLAYYRNASTNFQFSTEEDSDVMIGLPSRVFLGKVPEWTPDVRFFDSDEYPRLNHAHKYDVRGTFGLPVFERSNRTCLGVVEVVMTTQKIHYRSELESVRKALEAVDLRSSEVPSYSHEQAHNKSYEAVLPEIREVLRTVCETHKLPLAQTWVPCSQQGKGGCRHSDENFAVCVSTEDSACYVADQSFWDFHEACSEHHLFKGQGVAGKAFTTNQPCFSNDITTTFTKAEYPLLHYARMFQLRAAVAIRLRSIYTGTTDYVLEFFLPVVCQDPEEQKLMLNSLSMVIQRVCWSLRVLTDKELQQETVHLGEVGSSKGKPDTELPKLGFSIIGSPHEEPSWISHFVEAQQKVKTVPLEFQKENPTEEFKLTSHWDNPSLALQKGKTLPRQDHLDSGSKGGAECAGDSSFLQGNISGTGKTGEKRRTKAEKTISLQVLRQYFAGSLKDAAKSIGVCPTTLKRICRQHGITRWPSRKIKKVGHSLRKLQVVIDSVQGAEGAYEIGSFYANFPDLTSPNLTGTSPFPTLQTIDNPKPIHTQSGSLVGPQPAMSISPSSSCSRTSSSNLCCSNHGTPNQPQPAHLTGSEEASVAENSGVLNSGRGDAELHVQSQEPRIQTRSESEKSLGEHPNLESLAPMRKYGSHVSRDENAFRVKVIYGEEKIRFSMQSNWRFHDLQQQIARRLNIDDMNRIDLKYLDDDSEWVLLTCDADLEECVHIYKSFQTRTIKLSVYQSYQNFGTSLGSSGS